MVGWRLVGFRDAKCTKKISNVRRAAGCRRGTKLSSQHVDRLVAELIKRYCRYAFCGRLCVFECVDISDPLSELDLRVRDGGKGAQHPRVLPGSGLGLAHKGLADVTGSIWGYKLHVGLMRLLAGSKRASLTTFSLNDAS